MRSFKTEAIIIKRFNVGEADRLLTVFSKYDGKFTIRAKGIRRVPSRRSPHVELLNHSVLTLFSGKSMPLLTEASSIADYSEIKDDFAKVGFAYHLCELIDGLCPEGQEHTDVFMLLRQTLSSLSACQYDVNDTLSEIVHEFEIRLLTILGYWKYAPSAARHFNTTAYIEDILERRLKSRRIFAKIS